LVKAGMNRWIKAIIIGTAIEVLLLAIMFGVPWDSCKPEGFGLVLILLQYPVVLMEGRFPAWLSLGAAFVLCSLTWSLAAYVLLLLLCRRPK
jgi:hypothetical protein